MSAASNSRCPVCRTADSSAASGRSWSSATWPTAVAASASWSAPWRGSARGRCRCGCGRSKKRASSSVHLPRGAAAGRVRADRERPGAAAPDRGHAPLRPPLALRTRDAETSYPPSEPRRSRRLSHALQACVQAQEAFPARRKRGSVRDPVLKRGAQRLAAEAATRFSALVATGDEIPFDVAEDAGEGTLFHRYVPLTARYVAEREAELRSLPSFGPACGAVTRPARRPLPRGPRRHGRPIPTSARAKMLITFISAPVGRLRRVLPRPCPPPGAGARARSTPRPAPCTTPTS